MTRISNKQYHIAVEGNTEVLYFKHLQQLINSDPRCSIKVDFKVKKSTLPSSYVKAYSNISKCTLYCVYDVEGLNSSDSSRFNTILDDAKESRSKKDFKYVLAYSNLTFEVWMILHKSACCPVVDKKEKYCKTINQVYQQKYEDLSEYKEEKNFKRILQSITLEDVIVAVNNAKNIEKQNRNNSKPTLYGKHEYFKSNPSTSLHKLIEDILISSGIISSNNKEKVAG